MKIYIGTSGWQYYHWKEKFYPEDLPSKDFLKFYAKYFNTVEVNTSFYHFTKKSTFEKWKAQINADSTRINADIINNGQRIKNPHKSVSNPRKSAGFLFSIKLHRLFTHFRKLKLNKDDKRILKETIESYKVLGKNLGPILIQLPPSLKKDLKVLEKFLKNFESRRLTRMKTRIDADNKNTNESRIKRIRHEYIRDEFDIIRDELVGLKLAIEFRHKSWLDKETYNFLKKKKVAFVISDSPRWPTDIVKTSDFVYVRFHGKPHLFASKYEKEELQRYAKEIKKLKPKTLFAYFNNDAEGYAIEDALEFQKLF
jgi:uncharacterized protein YecE (DUF72 family)